MFISCCIFLWLSHIHYVPKVKLDFDPLQIFFKLMFMLHNIKSD